MGKYFSTDTDTSKYGIVNEEKNAVAMPSTDNLTVPLSNEKKERLSIIKQDNAPTQDDYIDMVKVQADAATDMVKKYSEESKQELKNQFEKFSPVELFEKINQLIFVVADLSNRVSSMEQTIKTGKVEQPQEMEITDPETLYRIQSRMEKRGIDNFEDAAPKSIPQQPENNTVDVPDINDVRRRLAEIKSGVKSIPSEGLVDKSIKLEEVFPNLDDEAYSAAYAAMQQNKVVEVTEERPQPGAMRGITGF